MPLAQIEEIVDASGSQALKRSMQKLANNLLIALLGLVWFQVSRTTYQHVHCKLAHRQVSFRL